MSLYALLHDGEPGDLGVDNVMCKRHVDVYLRADMDERGRIVVSTDARFEAKRRGTPRFLTFWDGPFYRQTVPVATTERADQGSTVNLTFTWTMLHGEPVVVR